MPSSEDTAPISMHSLYQGLRAIWNTEFPKTCPKCDRVYHSFEEYLVDTLPLHHSSGLMGYKVGDVGEQVGLFRNCACGTTIMAFCHDRRDLSESGYKRRELFAELMNRLIDNGISAQEARERLLKELRKAPDEDAFLKAIQIPQQ
ncbi:MAG: oxidoreductase [Verrucomicrobiae bacterium]